MESLKTYEVISRQAISFARGRIDVNPSPPTPEDLMRFVEELSSVRHVASMLPQALVNFRVLRDRILELGIPGLRALELLTDLNSNGFTRAALDDRLRKTDELVALDCEGNLALESYFDRVLSAVDSGLELAASSDDDDPISIFSDLAAVQREQIVSLRDRAYELYVSELLRSAL